MAGLEITPLQRTILDGVGDPPTRGDLAVVMVWSDERPLRDLGGLLDWRWAGHLSSLLRDEFVRGEPGETALLPADRRLPAERVVLFGLGARSAFGPEEALAAGRRLVNVVEGLRPRDVLIAMPASEGAQRATETMLLEVASCMSAQPRAAVDDEPTPLHPEVVWRVLADPQSVSRLRRLLEGPPRPAEQA